ncbi:uncharacterized protein LOC127445002 isoform X2 [Myxocyprinus asiaticus]|uniref:uncharacterized protein LOC127445002 isoform X2 n=1 Tax=Myxocyprinus asiaticus TaxID=70543 RepID=UPI002222D486|nr:uncharacterized protein LOC127445002 isoform X2 [Myxocyprinus asiaticus]
MNTILTLTLLMIPGAVMSISVTGYSGGEIIITCRYDKGYERNAKYFCRHTDVLTQKCKDLIRTDIKDEWTHEGRFSLYDDTRAAVFTVIIRDLNKQDSDKYYCGTDISYSGDLYTEVNLNVREGHQIRNVTGYSGGRVILNYKYEEEHKNRVKYDNSTAGLLQVFITNLNVNDSGEYQIQVKVSEEYNFFSELKLDVYEDGCCENFISLSAASGESVNISCRYSQSHRSDSKFVCRRSGIFKCSRIATVTEDRRWTRERQLQLYDDRMNLVLTVSISNVTDSAEYWCGVQSHQQYKSYITRVQLNVAEKKVQTTASSSPSSSSSSSPSSSSPSSSSSSPVPQSFPSKITSSVTTLDSSLIISLSVVLVLIIIGLLLLTVTLYKRHQTRGADSSSKGSHIRPGQNEAVRQTACDYEEIKDIRFHNDSDTGRCADYNTAQILTNPCDSANTLYCTVKHPSSDRQCCITSTDDLNYSAVNFQNISECVDHKSFINNQDYSEYATVNQATV